MAHLHLGLLAYWLVNTIRYQLKQKDIRNDWREIVRMMNTQKCVTTIAQNKSDEVINVRKCSDPEEKAKQIYDALNFKYVPFGTPRGVRKHKPNTYKDERTLQSNLSFGLKLPWDAARRRTALSSGLTSV